MIDQQSAAADTESPVDRLRTEIKPTSAKVLPQETSCERGTMTCFTEVIRLQHLTVGIEDTLAARQQDRIRFVNRRTMPVRSYSSNDRFKFPPPISHRVRGEHAAIDSSPGAEQRRKDSSTLNQHPNETHTPL